MIVESSYATVTRDVVESEEILCDAPSVPIVVNLLSQIGTRLLLNDCNMSIKFVYIYIYINVT